jgi:hypothetical protein
MWKTCMYQGRRASDREIIVPRNNPKRKIGARTTNVDTNVSTVESSVMKNSFRGNVCARSRNSRTPWHEQVAS